MLNRFKQVKDIKKIFNTIRPKYSIRKYANLLKRVEIDSEKLYNRGMKKKFSGKVITNEEKKAIIKWSKDNTKIKKVMWKLSNDKKAKKYVDILFSLFDKYESNLKNW